jgi:hypothetical protein
MRAMFCEITNIAARTPKLAESFPSLQEDHNRSFPPKEGRIVSQRRQEIDESLIRHRSKSLRHFRLSAKSIYGVPMDSPARPANDNEGEAPSGVSQFENDKINSI